MRLRRWCGCPGGRCVVRGSCCVSLCLGVLVVGFAFSPSWRCCFAGWLWVPGSPRVSCVSSCPLGAVCSGRDSLVPGSRGALFSAAVFSFPSEVAARRRVALRWLRACGKPAVLGAVACSWAVPFPSVLAAGLRSGALSLLWARCLRARAFRARALGPGLGG